MIPSDVWQAHVDHKRVHPFHFVLAITATHPPRGTAGQNAGVFPPRAAGSAVAAINR